MSEGAARSARSQRMLVLECAAVAIAAVGAVLANGVGQLAFGLLIAWLVYVIVREVRYPDHADAATVARDEPPGPFLVGVLAFMLITAVSFALVGDRLGEGVPRLLWFGLTVTVGSWVADRIRRRLLQLPRFSDAPDQG